MAREPASDINRAIGERLRARRVELGLSQRAVGEALGVTFQQVQKYEKGLDRVAADRIPALTACLRMTLGEFYGHASAPASTTSAFADAGAPFVSASAGAVAQSHQLIQTFMSIRSEETRMAIVELARRLAEADKSDRSQPR